MSEIKKGVADVTRYIMIVDSADGSPETGVTITSLDLQYTRNRSTPATKVDVTALGATNSVHADNKMIEVDATSSPGLYRVDWPDAAFAAGVDKVHLVVTGTGFAPAIEEITLVDNVVGDVVDGDGRVDVGSWLGTAVSTPDTAGIPEVNLANVATHGGVAAVLTLERAIVVSTTSGEPAIKLTGDAAGGEGLSINGGATNASAVLLAGTGSGKDLQFGGSGPNAMSSAIIVAGTFGADAINSSVLSTGAIIADTLADSAVTKIVDGILNEDMTGHQTQGTLGQAIGDPVADATTLYQACVTDATGDNVAVDVAALQTDLDNATDGLGALKTLIDALNDLSTADLDTAADAALDDVFVKRRNTATSGSGNTITLDGGAPTETNLYKGDLVHLVGGTGAGQSRHIEVYSSGRVATIEPNWTITPDATSIFRILARGRIVGLGADGKSAIGDNVWDQASSGHQVPGSFGNILGPVQSGTADSGSTTTLVDAALGSFANNYFEGNALVITDGTLNGQIRRIKDFATTSGTITVDRAFTGAISTHKYSILRLAYQEPLDAVLQTALGTDGTDVIPELSQAIPSATPTIADAIMLPYMALRNKTDITSTIKEVHNDAGTIIATKALTDSAGTYSEAEMIAGT